MASLKLSSLTKRFGSNVAVNAVDLTVDHGLLVCLLGPSGCGKTTTLRLLAGFIDPDGGQIAVDDRVISAPNATIPPEKRNMSMIFQSYALWPHMTIWDNVAYGLKLRRLPREEVERRVKAMLGVVKMSEYCDRYPSELSGGQQQRIALARALVVEPETLLLDEPLSNLDANLREEMRFEIRRLHDEFRYTTVYVTHDQSEAMTTADMIVVMNLGRIEQAGRPEEIYERPASEFVARFIGGTNILRGRHIGDGVVEGKGFRLLCAQGEPAGEGETAVSVRPHKVQMLQANPGAAADNVIRGRIVRQVYLGASRDYLVEQDSGDQVRLTTDTMQNVDVGSEVWLRMPPEHCRALPR